MADFKTLQTRIALKYDTYTNWTNEDVENQGANLVLLKGEIGLCEIPSGNTNVQTAPTVLFKVGDGEKPFKSLKWASALAADVYGWAKSETVELVEIAETVGDATVNKQYLQFKTGTTVNHSIDLSTFATDAELKATTDRVEALEDALGLASAGDGSIVAQIEDINERLDEITGVDNEDGSHTDGLIDTAIAGIEDKLGGNYDSTNTVAKAIEKAEADANSYTNTAIANLSKDGGAIFALDARVDALADQVGLESGETVKGVIAAAINDLDSVNVGEVTNGAANANTIVKSVSQADGVVTVTYGALTRAELPGLIEEDIPEIHANKVVVADATTDAEGNTVAKVTLDAKLTSIAGDISSIRDSIAGGVHFVGTIAADAEFPASANSGDVVIKGTQEYIYNGTEWEPLGDVTRLGAVEGKVKTLEETTIPDMAIDFDADEHKFVTGITQVNGKITVVDTARPTAENVLYGTQVIEGTTTEVTVKTKVDELAGAIDAVEDRASALETKVGLEEGETVASAISDALENLALTDDKATGEGNFVVSVTQENGQIAVVKGKLPEADATTKGIVTLGATGGAATFDAVNTLSQTVTTLKDNTVKAIDDRTKAIEADYVRIGTDNKMYKGKEGADYIVFDCGSATVLI